MSSVRYLFGNVDESGKLQDNDLPEDFRKTLEESDDYLSRILGDLGLASEDGAADSKTGVVKPDADAVDFSGIDELADEGTGAYQFGGATPMVIPRAAPVLPFARRSMVGGDLDEDYDVAEPDEEEAVNAHVQVNTLREPHATVPIFSIPTPPQPPPVQQVYDRARLAQIFPGFGEGELKFSEIFSAKGSRVQRPRKRLITKGGQPPSRAEEHLSEGLSQTFIHRKQPYPVAPDDRELFRQRLPPKTTRGPLYVIEKVEFKPVPTPAQVNAEKGDADLPSSMYPVVLEHWEDRVVWDDDVSEPKDHPASRIRERLVFRNYDLDAGVWESAIRWEGVEACESDQRTERTSPQKDWEESLKLQAVKRRGSILESKTNRLRRFNLSQDRLYDGLRLVGSDRVRQTYGAGTLQHALPAVKLHPLYFKPHLTKKELRSFHRPTLRIPLKTPIHFSRVRNIKKKKLKGKEAGELMRTPKDISLKDACRYALMEYSEEYPPIVMNTGMGSLVYNYYRKTAEKDPHVPVLDLGTPYILDEVDASPFFGFGDVEPGQTLQAISNNMFRAPIFRQEASKTDFLVIRHTLKGQSKYYIREIPHLFAVGQTFPLQEVPRPQSRRITQTIKGRLQVVTFRHMRRDPQKRLRYEMLVKSFPGFTEPQLRQRLKEFAQFAKKGENTGWWKLKPGIALPNEEEIRRLVTPEMVCLMESMLTGQQRLRDIGYSDIGMDEENDDEEINTDIEVQLAPWTLTKNFVQASQNKSMIKLYGPGDPSGRGEAFSFIRASMKEPFLRYGESAEERLGEMKMTNILHLQK
ncbi:uncharacterized protein SPPG_05569 [Spizellomyces punctatus DAOM BR117]|uniref:Transcription initiation factor TFIID subunit 1 histone acetyltransferase domain-containing protein n=1 Tax=Spizellomyces punctatus (strain DAOM BR117) TaxID=645134 RepID=A0A0L0HEA9_SPIPD|nr:uncharacterized protein SPPG_05569 [Spizellomyces punctatus DAOM BR117]KNC99319.1 hypothetical protein SPPG_05569 [Spizellomyces punctatus DAOM BR117]|eukprot:XP_016607359.1 hypothetical protein SPPG_05569 [Spizellomyces punctatus DAOM BR117]